ncbi:MAG TPA: PKD domain-containing protein [Burkholderiaceae bacterium]|nr:PKD domain-containing protein [Burkholderiaceae bacterium]
MDVTAGMKAGFNRAVWSCLAVVAALVLAGCGGGGNSNAGPNQGPQLTSAIGATPTAMSEPNGPAPLAVTFMAMEPKGAIASYEWDFKDNTAVVRGQSTEHTFSDPGQYTVTLTVRDATGNFNRASVMVSVSEGNTCAVVPAEFTATVWPAMSTTCTSCHMAGKTAFGTNLVFVAGGTELQQYNVLRAYAKTSSDTLLAKVVGGLNHSGGAPFGNTSSAPYQSLVGLVQTMKQPCTGGSDTNASAQFWKDVSFNDDQTKLAKAAILFAGRNPTAAEASAVSSGGAPVLRQTIRSFMTGPAFDAFLQEGGELTFLSRGVVVFGNNMGLNATDYPSAADVINNTNLAANVRNRFQTSMQLEPVNLMKYIVNNDKPWTDMVAGKYTVVNPLQAQYLMATVTGTFTTMATDAASDNELLPATLPNQRLPGTREHAGVVSTHAWLQRFPTTDTNRNRHRVYILAKQFLGTDVAALGMRPIDAGGNFKMPTVENPNCSVCHSIIDPMAAGFQNWNEANRYLPFRTASGVDHALPNTYRSNNYPKDKDGKAYYQDGDNWFRDQAAPAYGNTPMPGGVRGNNTALQWMGGQVAADQRFAIGAVQYWYRIVFNREPLKASLDSTAPGFAAQTAAYNAQMDEFKEIAARFAMDRGNGAYNVKDLLVDLVLSKWFTAEKVAATATAAHRAELADVGSKALLNPAALNRKLMSLTGMSWNQFNNPYAGQALNYGNFDGGLNRPNRANDYTMVQTMIADRAMAELSCSMVMTDMNKASMNRLMLAGVTLADTPTTNEAAILQTIKGLHKSLLMEDLPVTDAEVQRTYGLFKAVWMDRATAPTRPTACAYNNNNDPNYTARSWAAVIGYMIGDEKFLFN